jgi:lipopolysaccharide transport system ATP-binding protein
LGFEIWNLKKMSTVITIEHLSKRYHIGEGIHHTHFRDIFDEKIRNLFKKNNNTVSNENNIIWALKDISFEVKEAEVIGVIGRNGAGKSTLLKILSRITEPTEGRVKIKGRVASLLEVGTGFSPELTGRENIYLNGAILGMRKTEIDKKFDEIVAFAEVEKFIDTPTKRYSSGMYMRLAFAVAAHLEPEILLVDEVLAVGDMAFQKKCLGKMGDISKGGRTILFVSHNMTAINILCYRAILLEQGYIKLDGITSEVVDKYLKSTSERNGEQIWKDPETAPGNSKVRLHAVRIISDGQVKGEVDIDKEIIIEVEFWNLIPGNQLFTNIFLLDSMGVIVLESANTPRANKLPEKWFCQPHPVGLFRSTCVIPGNFLNEGQYHITAFVASCNPPTVEAEAKQVVSFSVFDTGVMRTPGFSGRWNGVVRIPLAWRIELIEDLQFKTSLE